METIIEKIRKLLAMADLRSGATEHERETALRMASSLMMRHSISETQIRVKAKIEGKWYKERHTSYWYQLLATAAAKINMCRTMVTTNGYIQFVGRPEAIETSAIFFEHLEAEVGRLFKEHLAVIGRLPSGKYRDQWKIGCAIRICHRVDDMMAELKDDKVAMERTGSTALVVASTIEQRLNEVGDWIAETYPHTKEEKKQRKTKPRSFDHATARGYQAGDRVKIQEALE